jgi:hypothetical protein
MLLLTTVALAAALQGTTQGRDFRWTGSIARGKTLEVMGVNGDVRASLASGSRAAVTGVKSTRRSDPESVEIKVEESADRVTICVVYPSRGQSSCHGKSTRRNHDSNENNDVRVDFTVNVPAGVRFIGRTVNGEMEARNLEADADVSTVNGNVEVSTQGFAEATTVNGDVTVSVGRGDWNGQASFQTVNGSVTVTLPASLNADVKASTVNGDIDSDFPLTVRGKFGPRSVNGTIGSGGRMMSLGTVNGSIYLRKR